MTQDSVADNSEIVPKSVKPERTSKSAKAKKPPRIPKNIKVWCERTQKYYYKAKPEYYREYYHKTKKETVCPHCGSVINSQFSHHLETKKCTTIRRMKELETKLVELEKTVTTEETEPEPELEKSRVGPEQSPQRCGV